MKSRTLLMLITAVLVGVLLGAWGTRYVGTLDVVMEAIGARRSRGAPTAPSTGAQPSAGTPGHDKGDHPDQRQGQEEHSEVQVVRLSEAERQEFGIEVGVAAPGKLQIHVTLPGEVTLNADRRAHIVPRLPGAISEVRKSLGDQVRAGEVMAVLESRELADLKAAYLAAKARLALAEAAFRREEDLWKKNISAEQEYLEAKKALAEARIEIQAAEKRLQALGFSGTSLAQLSTQPDTAFTQYAITAPFDGTVIEKHVTLGAMLKDDTIAFVIADLHSVWVDLRVYQKDLPVVRKGQPVVIAAGHGIPDAQGTISYVGPLVGAQTRTALARVVLPNPHGLWRPGLFVAGKIVVEDVGVALLVPKTALQTIEERPVVFVETTAGFQPQPLTLGRSNDTHVEITAGLTPGQRYVTSGAFALKAQLSKGAFGDDHGH